MAAPDADFDTLLARQAELIDIIEAHDAWELDSRLDQAMDALRLPPGDADVTVLSGGERRRVALCKLLLQQPDLLLLDEPTNHLDAESVAWLEQHLAKYPGAVLAVTHDRYFLDNVAEWILELDRGRAYPYEGNYSTYLETKQSRLKVEGNKDAKRQRAARPGAGVGALQPQGAPGQEQVPGRALRGAGGRGRPHPADGLGRDPHPAGSAAGQPGDRGHQPRQGLRRPPADPRPVVQPAARRHRRRHRPERRRQDHAVLDDRRPAEARRRQAHHRSDRRHRLRRPEPLVARPRRRTSGRSSPTA